MDIRPFVLLARAISQDYGVSVRFSDAAGTASCSFENGEHVITLPLSDAPNRDALYKGYIDHEVGHVRFTDFDLNQPDWEVERVLSNIFEDEYVERRMGALFPGSKSNLQRLGRIIFTEDHVGEALAAGGLSVMLAFALYHRRALLDPELGKWNDRIDEAVKSLGATGDELREMLAIAARRTDGTGENIKAAVDMGAVIRRVLGRAEKKKNSQGQSQDQSQGDGQGQSQDQSQGDGQGEDYRRNDDMFSVGERASAALADSGARGEFPLLSATPELRALAVAARLLSKDDSREDARSLKTAGILYSVELDQRVLSALRRRIPALLQTSRIRPAALGSRGRLSGKRLARAAALDPNVFFSPMRKLEQEIGVGFLSDYSGSMRNDGAYFELDKAVYASLVMLRELPKVSSFAFGFNSAMYRKLAGRDERLREFLGARPQGSTPLASAMLNMSAEFIGSGRRILIVTTDGCPDGPLDEVQAIIRLLAGFRIETYAVGIGSAADYLPKVFGEDNSAVINDVADYAPALEKMLRRALLCAA